MFKSFGEFLAACFDLEYTMDSIIDEVFFPTPRSESVENIKRLFDEMFLKTRCVHSEEK